MWKIQNKSTPSQRLWFRLVFLVMCSLSLLTLESCSCGDPEITQRNFECETHDSCKKDQLCEAGKCIKADNDKDGWAKNKDCNDKNQEIYPGAPEICDNKLDDNCDGNVDETPCQCEEGQKRECGSAEGECKKGEQTCDDNGDWGECKGEIKPADETCNGKDDNCDGSVDEDLKDCCKTGETRACGSDEGECQEGIQQCNDGTWSICQGKIDPRDEVCDGRDNDCDGKTDNKKDSPELLRQSCYEGPKETQNKGECKDGERVCEEGKWTTCKDDVRPKEEDCNQKDDDCDGNIDNGKGGDPLERECYSGKEETKGKGRCKSGKQACNNGTWEECKGEVKPKDEECNDEDDDCDGRVDEGLSRECYPSNTKGCTESNGQWTCQGACQAGQQSCSGGKWGSCEKATAPQTETCNGKDDDCDGKTDNIAGQSAPLHQTCYTGASNTRNQGVCKDGKQSCNNGNWDNCIGEVKPSNEICDGKDNNCNGQVDENTGVGGYCTTNQPGICRTGTKVCSSNGRVTCKPNKQPQTETCNGQDDDCDGRTDENNPGGGSTCNVPGKRGPCQKGEQLCSGGQIVCKQKVFPSSERPCNQRDDDCDGTIDEAKCAKGYQCGGASCQRCNQPPDKNCSVGFCSCSRPCACGYTDSCTKRNFLNSCTRCSCIP